MENINWNYPTPIWFGQGRINEIQQACDNLNISKPLIVTDPGILKTDIITTYAIHDVLINHKSPLISESGIKTKEELLDIAKKTSIKTFLIGESLLKNLDKNSIFSVL